jgi:hypothetical protein
MKRSTIVYSHRLFLGISLIAPLMSLPACSSPPTGDEPDETISARNYRRQESAPGSGRLDGTSQVAIAYESAPQPHTISVEASDLESGGSTESQYNVRDMTTNTNLAVTINDDMNEVTLDDGTGNVHAQLVSETQAVMIHADGRRESLSMDEFVGRAMQTLTSARVSPHSLVVIDDLVTHDNNPNVSLGFKSFFKKLWRGVKKVVKVVARPFVDAWARVFIGLTSPLGGASDGDSDAAAP